MADTRGPGPIPDRWLLCPRKANGMVAGKFLAFKTPLDKRYNSQIPALHLFYPSMIVSIMDSYKVKLGLWIDLTFTSRFYNKEDVEAFGAKYVKLQCRGHGETPSRDQTKTFIDICDKFIRTNPLESIGVHCTHGFNRTGFLIIAYMVEKMDFSVDAALHEFSTARPPGIYKVDYIQELYKRYDDINDMPLPPERPDWCREFDDGDGNDGEQDNGEEGDNSNSSGGSSNQRRGKSKKTPVFMQGVPGVSVVHDPKKTEVQKRAQEMCGWRKSGFPGSQPVSMDMKNINLLAEKPYRVSWKADGTRYMMLILRKNEIFFLDRDNSVFQVENLRFPMRKDPQRHIENTLLDGEMVIDKTENGESIPRYLVYDIIKFNNQELMSQPFYPIRYNCIREEIVDTRNNAMMKGLINKAVEPFSVRRKEFWDLMTTGYLLSDKFAKKLSHEPDGLIFQPSSDPYVAGQCPESLKWKPSSHNSVDFRAKIVTESGEGLLTRKIFHLFAGGMDHPFGTMKYSKALKDMNNKIVECKFNNGQWEFMRERTDKSFPNSYNTAVAVFNSIRDPVTTEYLLEFIDRCRWRADDQDLMPPPAKIRRC
ncbi:mRNA-capping enzyme [Thrips palmi]|uniref:mRNA-capping enzyme n=1 Tax=Thrips palmi TaxID=161013 RepID=A0A6P8Y2C1_THRPL|nr:mRNA-capping enzyme [Thrips palmi]XP_034230435.1 mRNA-capping enzyme [Thrips palmi]XP_034230436.1 mRNA-capping enzyme [Thrips palmi]XP_034230437.1 mRNA-capping enzyme [Thrips palmi]XP_034230438.1 mRNA-capping enzyme [Thrips palmi]